MYADLAPQFADADALFRRYYSYIFAVVRRSLGTRLLTDRSVEPADLAQEAALDAFRNIDSYCPDRGKFTTWIALITTRTVSHFWERRRAKRRTPMRGATIKQLRSMAEPRAPMARVHSASPDFWNIVSCELVGRERRIVELRFNRNLSFKDIGPQMGMKERHARRVCDQAIAKLRPLGDRLADAAGLN